MSFPSSIWVQLGAVLPLTAAMLSIHTSKSTIMLVLYEESSPLTLYS
jgi:hypothetical protein